MSVFACRTWKEVSGIRCWSPWNSWLVEVFSVRSLLRVIMYKNLSVHLVFSPEKQCFIKTLQKRESRDTTDDAEWLWHVDERYRCYSSHSYCINSISIKSPKEKFDMKWFEDQLKFVRIRSICILPPLYLVPAR